MGKKWEFPELGIRIVKREDKIIAKLHLDERGISNDLWLYRVIGVNLVSNEVALPITKATSEYIYYRHSEKEVEERVKKIVSANEEEILSDLFKKLKLFNSVVGAIRKVYGREVEVQLVTDDC